MPGWARRLLAVLGVGAAVYGVVALDVVLRARSAYLEGEKYMRWHLHPEEKKAHFESEYLEKKAGLDASHAKGEIGKEEFEDRLELALFERDHLTGESSAKYAYIWFQTAVELFTPPESRWVEKARGRMAEARRIWQEELKAKGIPFEGTMFE